MNRELAVRYFLLRHLWTHKAEVDPKLHAEIALTLKVYVENDDYRISWQVQGKNCDYRVASADLSIYERGDSAKSSGATNEAILKNRITAQKFVAAAYRYKSEGDRPTENLETNKAKSKAVYQWGVWALSTFIIGFFSGNVSLSLYVLAFLPLLNVAFSSNRIFFHIILVLLSFTSAAPLILVVSFVCAILEFLNSNPRFRNLNTTLSLVSFVISIFQSLNREVIFSVGGVTLILVAISVFHTFLRVTHGTILNYGTIYFPYLLTVFISTQEKSASLSLIFWIYIIFEIFYTKNWFTVPRMKSETNNNEEVKF